MKYQINGKGFNTKTQITEHFRAILRRNIDEVLNEDDTNDILDLLTYHKDYQEKLGLGIDHVKVEFHIDNLTGLPAKHPHFQLYRIDGTDIDFSFPKTIGWIKNEKSVANQHIKDVKASMRFIVKRQINDFRNKLFESGQYHKCPIININFSKVTSHIDHAPPLMFDQMVYNFLKENNLKFKDIELVDINGIYSTFKNETLRKQWYNYHKDNAILRGTHRAGNLSQSKTKINWGDIIS